MLKLAVPVAEDFTCASTHLICPVNSQLSGRKSATEIIPVEYTTANPRKAKRRIQPYVSKNSSENCARLIFIYFSTKP
jgi:hypothetical protein